MASDYSVSLKKMQNNVTTGKFNKLTLSCITSIEQ